jgi:hypothetical protein
MEIYEDEAFQTELKQEIATLRSRKSKNGKK